MSEAVEHLDVEPPHPRRWRLVAVVVIVLLLGAAGWWDRHQYDDRASALARCAAEVRSATSYAVNRVSAMATYVNPTLSSAPPGRLHDGLEQLISQAADEARDSLDAPREACADVHGMRTHPSIETRRSACLETLSRHAAYLQRIAAGGSPGSPGDRGC